MSKEILSNRNTLLAYWDKELVCRYVNNDYVEWFGIDPADSSNMIRIDEFLGPFFAGNALHIKEVLNGKTKVFAYDIINGKGEAKNILATYLPDFENTRIAGFNIYVDITYKPAHLPQGINLPKDEKEYSGSNEKALVDIIDVLKASLLSGFPGISALSKSCFISESKLKRDFKMKYNTTVFSFYRNLQMELAETYIKEKQYSKKQLAALLNFSNPSNFSSCYNKYLKSKPVPDELKKAAHNNDFKYKAYIRQAPFSIAMFDISLNYLAASQKWIDHYGLKHKEIVGLYIDKIIPQKDPKWQKIYSECLEGKIYSGEESTTQQHGTPLWLRWDIRPWYQDKNEIGGIIMLIEDITLQRLQDAENHKTVKVIEMTNRLSDVGEWKKNFNDDTSCLSK